MLCLTHDCGMVGIRVGNSGKRLRDVVRLLKNCRPEDKDLQLALGK